MSLKQEIAELCMAIYLFETDIAPLKEQLFNIPTLSKQLIWNHVVGETYNKSNLTQLVYFFGKHGLTILKSDASLLIETYSSNKDNLLTMDDLWQIFKPLTIKFTEEINETRRQRYPLAKSHQAHYRISDLLCKIMKRTIQFLRTSYSMKENIAGAKADQIVIKPVDPAHLQIYINQYAPTLLKKDVQLVFKHIMRNQIICEKTIKEYFIPSSYNLGSPNPNSHLQLQQSPQLLGLELTKYHFSNVNYLKSSIKKRPLYLIDTVKRY